MKQIQAKLGRLQQRATRHSLHWCLVPLCVMLVSAGCKPPAKVAPESNPAGTYNLVSVDGKNVPCALEHEGHKLTIKSGAFIINPDGTCSSKMVFVPPGGNDATREVKATYTRQGSTLTMKWEGAGMTTGTAEGDTFTMNNEGMVLAYRK
jgi:hypothetical protein